MLFVVKFQGIHFCTNDVVVDFLAYRPVFDVKLRKLLLDLLQATVLLFHCCGSVVRNPVGELRLLEFTKLTKQLNQILKSLLAAATGPDNKMRNPRQR